MVNKAGEKEQYTARLPEMRVKPSQLKRWREKAALAGMGEKFSEWVRMQLDGKKIEQKPVGMPRPDVIANLPELANLRARLIDRPDLLPIIDRISQRHRNALLHDPKSNNPR